MSLYSDIAVNNDEMRVLMKQDAKRNGYLSQLREKTIAIHYFDDKNLHPESTWQYLLKVGKRVANPWDIYNQREVIGRAIFYRGFYHVPTQGLINKMDLCRKFYERHYDKYDY